MPSDQKSHLKGGKSLNEWLCYLETIHETEIDLGLSRIRIVAQRLAIDLSFATVITVAGTNGKGTTCAFLENALCREHKHKDAAHSQLNVAVYSSPHIECFNERLRINHCDVDDIAFIKAFEQIELARDDISLSYYEFTTLAAFVVLMASKPEIIILEVGLGGRLDATNIIDADVAVITSVDIDHQAFLGNDRETIGFEKAGIMRAEQDIIVGDFTPPKSVLKHASDINQALEPEKISQALAKIKVRGKDFTIVDAINADNTLGFWQWQYRDQVKGEQQTFQIKQLIPTSIPRDNVATALMVLKQLGVALTSEKVNRLIQQTKVAGRTEMFKFACDVMLDVGHNPHAGRYLANQLSLLKTQHGYTNVIAVCAMLADKDIKNTLSALSQRVDYWYIAPLAVPRSATTEYTSEILGKFTQAINCFDNITQAFKIASEDAKPTDLILVFGSFFTVAEIRKLLI